MIHTSPPTLFFRAHTKGSAKGIDCGDTKKATQGLSSWVCSSHKSLPASLSHIDSLGNPQYYEAERSEASQLGHICHYCDMKNKFHLVKVVTKETVDNKFIPQVYYAVDWSDMPVEMHQNNITSGKYVNQTKSYLKDLVPA